MIKGCGQWKYYNVHVFHSLIEDCNGGGDHCSSDEDSWHEDGEKKENGVETNEEVASTDVKPEQPQICGWVPPQCCLIPLPASPDGSDDEKEEAEDKKSGFVISESDLQKQHEKELEVLFGYKQPPLPSSAVGGTTDGGEGWNTGSGEDVFVGENNDNEVLVAARGNKRCNSSDSGVASISPHSSEGDLEQRSNQNGIETVVTVVDIVQTTHETEQDEEEAHTGSKQRQTSSSSSEDRVKLNLTLEQYSEEPHVPVSRLKAPSEKCSVFTGSVSMIHVDVSVGRTSAECCGFKAAHFFFENDCLG